MNSYERDLYVGPVSFSGTPDPAEIAWLAGFIMDPLKRWYFLHGQWR